MDSGPSLYVANCTQQNHLFSYAVDDRIRTQPIRPGSQIRVSGDLSTLHIEKIIRHHVGYGMAPAEEAGLPGMVLAGRECPLIFSTGKPIAPALIEAAMSHNMAMRTEEGRQIRMKLAIAVNKTVEDKIRADRIPARLLGTEMTVQEDRSDLAAATLAQVGIEGASAKQFSEGVIVRPDEQKTDSPQQGRRRQKRAA